MPKEKLSGKLFILSGPSGAGKGTICSQLLRETDVELSVSMTTRSPRTGEIDGISYYFVTREGFLKTIEEEGFLEYAQVYGNYYGTPKEPVLRKLAAGIDKGMIELFNGDWLDRIADAVYELPARAAK